MKIRHPCASEGLEGVRRGMVEASIGEDGQRAHSGENDENPQEHPVHHHCHILPIFFQLKEASERQEIKKKKNGYDRKKMNIRKGKQWENGKRQTDTRDKKTTVQTSEIKPCCSDKK